jgi:hypothetical protein
MSNTASTMMICPVCELSGGPFRRDEAAVHLTTHNQVHHRGAPTAVALASVLTSDYPAAA